MTYTTEADRRLAEQRQRHGRYLRHIDREPGLNSDRGVLADAWRPPWVEKVTENAADDDRERLVRDLVDSELDGGPGQHLDAFVEWVVANDMWQAFRKGNTLPDRVNNLLAARMGGGLPDLHTEAVRKEAIESAIGLMRYADKLRSFTVPADS